MIYRDIIKLETESNDFYDITDKIKEIIEKSQLQDGLCNVFIQGTTASLMINEKDRMLVEDFRKLFDALAPDEHFYQHPDNAQSHLRAAFFHQDLTIPVANKELILGTWQNILLWEFDVRPRQRELVITVQGV